MDLGLDIIEREIGEESGDGSQPMSDEMLGRIKVEIGNRIGVGLRNVHTDNIDPDLLALEVGILYPVRGDAETLAAVLETLLRPIKWWKVSVFPHPNTHRLIVEAKRRKSIS